MLNFIRDTAEWILTYPLSFTFIVLCSVLFVVWFEIKGLHEVIEHCDPDNEADPCVPCIVALPRVGPCLYRHNGVLHRLSRYQRLRLWLRLDTPATLSLKLWQQELHDDL